MRTPGPWLIFLAAFGEMLPNRDNRITLHPTKTDAFGIRAHIECVHGENDMKMAKAMVEDAKATNPGRRAGWSSRAAASLGRRARRCHP